MSTRTLTLLEHGVWRVDRSRSTVGFLIRHMGVATVRGRFSSFAGRIDVTGDGLVADGVVDVASVDTGNGIRDGRLRAEFFDAERFPAMTFRTDRSLPASSGRWRLRGDLTIRGVTRPVELLAAADRVDDGTVRVHAEGKIRRTDFGLDWDALQQAGRTLVADHVRLTADVVLVRELDPEPDDR